MARPLSLDLRERVVAAIEGGLSCRQAAERFGVSAASAIRWRARQRQTGQPLALPQGGDKRSGQIEAHADLILGLSEAVSDITLHELQARLSERGVRAGIGTLWRFFARRKITWKKSRHTRPSRIARTS